MSLCKELMCEQHRLLVPGADLHREEGAPAPAEHARVVPAHNTRAVLEASWVMPSPQLRMRAVVCDGPGTHMAGKHGAQGLR
jgi:hypothetical protein